MAGIDDEMDKQFFKYQREWYKKLKEFMDKGDDIQKEFKKTGAVAPTEILMFILFWEMVTKKYSLAEQDFIKYMLINLLEDDSYKDKLVDSKIAKDVAPPRKKFTLH